MGREHRSSLRSARPLCPSPAVGLCDDLEVNGAPFYVMEFVDGPCSATQRARGPRRGARRAACDIIVDMLATIHDVDVDAVGLGTSVGKRATSAAVEALDGQFEDSKTRELPEIEEVHDAPRRPHPRAAVRRDRARRLPPRQLHASARRRLVQCSTGRSARWAILCRRRPADGVLEGARRRAGSLASPPTARRRASRPAPSCSSATPKRSGRDVCRHRLLHRVRVLEARLHRRGCVRRAIVAGAMGDRAARLRRVQACRSNVRRRRPPRSRQRVRDRPEPAPLYSAPQPSRARLTRPGDRPRGLDRRRTRRGSRRAGARGRPASDFDRVVRRRPAPRLTARRRP